MSIEAGEPDIQSMIKELAETAIDPRYVYEAVSVEQEEAAARREAAEERRAAARRRYRVLGQTQGVGPFPERPRRER